MKKALLLVDLQNDFCAGGRLAVPEGEQVIPVANQFMLKFDRVIATQDWHPVDHLSFASQHPGKKIGEVIQLQGQSQVLWPDHCVQHTKGAAFHPNLNTQRIMKIFQKGTDRNIDSYSGFYDNGHFLSTGLAEWLRAQDVSTLYVMGLATDYCVKFTCLDAIAEGFKVYLVTAGCRGVNLQPKDVENALAQMQSSGVLFVASSTGDI